MDASRLITLVGAVLIGAALGIGTFTFGYAAGWSYLSSDPAACSNCHIMDPQLESWMKSGHHAVAVCNDCHLPHGPISKWVAKARNGFNHSWAFTFQDFPEPIQITPVNAAILQEACLSCHGDLVHELVDTARGEAATCVHCHAGAGHGPRARLGR